MGCLTSNLVRWLLIVSILDDCLLCYFYLLLKAIPLVLMTLKHYFRCMILMMLLLFQVILHIVTYLKCALRYHCFQLIANLIHWPWPRWQYQVIAWTNVDFSLLRFCGIHLKTISQWMPKLQICRMRPKLNCWNYCHVSQGQWVKENALLLCPTVLFCWSLIS